MHELPRTAGLGRNCDVKALFHWPCMRPHCITMINITDLQLIQYNAEFHFLYNGAIIRPHKKCNEPFRFKDQIHFVAPSTRQKCITHAGSSTVYLTWLINNSRSTSHLPTFSKTKSLINTEVTE